MKNKLVMAMITVVLASECLLDAVKNNRKFCCFKRVSIGRK